MRLYKTSRRSHPASKGFLLPAVSRNWFSVRVAAPMATEFSTDKRPLIVAFILRNKIMFVKSGDTPITRIYDFTVNLSGCFINFSCASSQA
jgi:hypothetical protein